jgi:hypothetical protein
MTPITDNDNLAKLLHIIIKSVEQVNVSYILDLMSICNIELVKVKDGFIEIMLGSGCYRCIHIDQGQIIQDFQNNNYERLTMISDSNLAQPITTFTCSYAHQGIVNRYVDLQKNMITGKIIQINIIDVNWGMRKGYVITPDDYKLM